MHYLKTIKALLWVGTSKGIEVFDINNEFTKLHHFFPDLFCTHITQDRENGYWITTSSEGVHYCPSIDVLHFPSHFKGKNQRITGITSDDSCLYTSNYYGQVFQTNTKGQTTLLNDDQRYVYRIYSFHDKLWVSSNRVKYVQLG